MDWASRFRPAPAGIDERPADLAAGRGQDRPDEAWRALDGQPVRVFLDYDGTLVPHTEYPEDAGPDQALLELLGALCDAAGIAVEIVSGRTRMELERWLGRLPLTLWAEHGALRRDVDGTWTQTSAPAMAWRPPLQGALERFCAAVSGSFIEDKEYGVAWHHRAALVAPGQKLLRHMVDTLEALVSADGLEVLEGDGVLEVRGAAAHKGRAITSSEVDAGAEMLVAIGDDRTDEDMFLALPRSAISIVVGTKPSHARYRVAGVDDVRGLLSQLARRRPTSGARKAT